MTTIDAIQAAVCAEFGLTRSELLGRGKLRRITIPRHVGYLLATEMTCRSVTVIARLFRRDHKTILQSLPRIRDRIARDRALAEHVASIREALTNPGPSHPFGERSEGVPSPVRSEQRAGTDQTTMTAG